MPPTLSSPLPSHAATIEQHLLTAQFGAAEALLLQWRTEAADSCSAALQGEIAFCQALLDLAQGRLRRARDAAKIAVDAARDGQDLKAEISALALQALASARIGQPVESVELALLATELAARTEAGTWSLRAEIALANAYLWNANIAMAKRSLERLAEQSASDPTWAGAAELAELSAWIAYRDRMTARVSPHAVEAQVEPTVVAYITPKRAPLSCVFPGQQSTGALMARFRVAMDVPTETNVASATPDDTAFGAGFAGHEAFPALLQSVIAIEHGYASRHADWIRDALSAACLAASALESEALGALARQAAASALLALNVRDAAAEVLVELAQIEQQRLSRDLNDRRQAATTQIEARANAQANRVLRAHTLELERLAYEDSLTGVANKRRFQDRIGEWFAQGRDAGEPFAIALIDLDRFKQINDVFGHDIGDLVLKEVGNALCANLRERDLAARIGGDEFALLFRGTTDEVARLVCDRIESQVGSFDWASVKTGLRVSLSIGVAEAQTQDSPQSLVQRADEDMYRRKRARKHLYGAYRDRDEEAVSPIQIEHVVRCLQQARTVSVLVGSGYAVSQNGLASGENFSAWRVADRQRFATASALRKEPNAFLAHWTRLREELAKDTVPALFTEVERLYCVLSYPAVITERTDEWLQRAGVPAPIEIYGSLFKDACGICSAPLHPDARRCAQCGAQSPLRRPAITLLDEEPERQSLNYAELQAKRSDVVLVLESDLTLAPTRSLIDKAKVRGATIVMLGSGPQSSMELVDACVLGGSLHVVQRLVERLAQNTTASHATTQLSPDGAVAHAFLAGNGKDHAGRTLQRMIEMSDLDYAVAPDLAGWQFPLPRRGRNCPLGPAPTPHDFAMFAQDIAVIDAMRRSFARTLAVLGLEWVEGEVCKAGNWERRFDWWANRSGDHDYRISRMIESLSLIGLSAEAGAIVRFMERELRNHRHRDASVALWHWKNAMTVEYR